VENTITIASKRLPSAQSVTRRFWHGSAPKKGSVGALKRQTLSQVKYGVELFWQDLPQIEIKPSLKAIPLGDVFYISVGMVLNANEKKNKGAFVLDNLIIDKCDNEHVAPYVGGKDICEYGCSTIRYLEYGSGTRVPSQIRRPTFQELYDRPKIMIARFGGITYDDGAWDEAGFLKCNHTVMLLLAWHVLKAVKNQSLESEVKARKRTRSQLEASSALFDPWYLLAYLSSRQVKEMLAAVASSGIRGEIQPDDLRQISIPQPDDLDLTKKVIALAQKATGIQKQLLPLRTSGWTIRETTASAPALVPKGSPVLTFDQARIKWNLIFKNPSARVDKLTRVNHRLCSGKQEAASIPSTEPEAAMEWLRRQFLMLPTGTTLGEIESNLKPSLPETPALAEKALAIVLGEEAKVSAELQKLIDLKKEISLCLDLLFKHIRHPPIEDEMET
jgi:hypothetical protein